MGVYVQDRVAAFVPANPDIRRSRDVVSFVHNWSVLKQPLRVVRRDSRTNENCNEVVLEAHQHLCDKVNTLVHNVQAYREGCNVLA